MIFDLNDTTATRTISTYVTALRIGGGTVGLTSGCFDAIHFHHVLYLTRCRRHCDVLIVGVDSDELVRAIKGDDRPQTYDSRRVVMVDALKPVTFAFIMNSVADFGIVAKLVEPDVIFKNDEFQGKEDTVVGRQHAKNVRIIRDVVDYNSTTQMLEAAGAARRP